MFHKQIFTKTKGLIRTGKHRQLVPFERTWHNLGLYLCLFLVKDFQFFFSTLKWIHVAVLIDLCWWNANIAEYWIHRNIYIILFYIPTGNYINKCTDGILFKYIIKAPWHNWDQEWNYVNTIISMTFWLAFSDIFRCFKPRTLFATFQIKCTAVNGRNQSFATNEWHFTQYIFNNNIQLRKIMSFFQHVQK